MHFPIHIASSFLLRHHKLTGNHGHFSALVIATTLALCDMAATVPVVTALLLALVATLGLGTLGLLIGAAALFELRVSLEKRNGACTKNQSRQEGSAEWK